MLKSFLRVVKQFVVEVFLISLKLIVFLLGKVLRKN